MYQLFTNARVECPRIICVLYLFPSLCSKLEIVVTMVVSELGIYWRGLERVVLMF